MLSPASSSSDPYNSIPPSEPPSEIRSKSLDKIKSRYGDWFCGYVYPETIACLPKFTPMLLNLSQPWGIRLVVTQEHLQGKPIARFTLPRSTDGTRRAGIAINCRVYKNGVPVKDIVELIFQKSEVDLKEPDPKRNYKSQENRGTDGEIHASYLNSRYHGFDDMEMERVRGLLEGREIAGSEAGTTLKLVAPAPLTLAQKILITYGKAFCDAIGMENLVNLPEMTTEELGISPWWQGDPLVPLSKLKGQRAVRFNGKFAGSSFGASGIAVHVHRFDRTQQKIVECVDVIFMFFGLAQCYHLSGLHNREELRSQYPHGGLYESSMNFEKVSQLLTGAPIVTNHELDKGLQISMTPPKEEGRGIPPSVLRRLQDSYY